MAHPIKARTKSHFEDQTSRSRTTSTILNWLQFFLKMHPRRNKAIKYAVLNKLSQSLAIGYVPSFFFFIQIYKNTQKKEIESYKVILTEQASLLRIYHKLPKEISLLWGKTQEIPWAGNEGPSCRQVARGAFSCPLEEPASREPEIKERLE